MTMREKIARALFERGPFGAWGSWDEAGSAVQSSWLSSADVILEAMREPDEAMASKGMHRLALLPEDDVSWPTLARAACGVWQAMIDQASHP